MLNFIWSYLIINLGSGFLSFLMCVFENIEKDHAENNTTRKQKIFGIILMIIIPGIAGIALGYLMSEWVAKFLKWLATEDKQKINSCKSCKHINKEKCKILNVEIKIGECPCEGKLFENL